MAVYSILLPVRHTGHQLIADACLWFHKCMSNDRHVVGIRSSPSRSSSPTLLLATSSCVFPYRLCVCEREREVHHRLRSLQHLA